MNVSLCVSVKRGIAGRNSSRTMNRIDKMIIEFFAGTTRGSL